MERERGFTLVELVIAAAITGVIVSVVGGAIYQIIKVTDYGQEKMIALNELQNVAHWFGRDGQSASQATGGSELVLTIPDSSPITYSLVGTELRRTSGGSSLTLARNISSASFAVNERLITLTLTSSPQGKSNINEQATYQVLLRASQGE